MTWRTKPLPRGWDKTRSRILRRDGYVCQLRYDVCTAQATQVDHITGPHDESDTNLQAVCVECHRVKTARDTNAARPKRQRPAEPHPGRMP